MKKVTSAPAKALFLLIMLLVIITSWSCNKDPQDGGSTITLTASLSVDKTTVVYDGISSDSTVTATWSASGATNAVLDNTEVGTAGTKTVTLFDSKTFEFKASNGKETKTASKTVTVTIDPQLALLCSGWFRIAKNEYQDATTKVWHDWGISEFWSDDQIKFAINRKQFWDFGTKRESLQHQYGYADTAFTLSGVQKNILHMGNINWTIVSLTQSQMVLEGYIPGLFGSPDVYARETYARTTN